MTGEPGYEFPQRITTPEGLRGEFIRIRDSQRKALGRGDHREAARLGRRIDRLNAVRRWRGWQAFEVE